jgi:hypothetical protein
VSMDCGLWMCTTRFTSQVRSTDARTKGFGKNDDDGTRGHAAFDLLRMVPRRNMIMQEIPLCSIRKDYVHTFPVLFSLGTFQNGLLLSSAGNLYGSGHFDTVRRDAWTEWWSFLATPQSYNTNESTRGIVDNINGSNVCWNFFGRICTGTTTTSVGGRRFFICLLQSHAGCE